MGPNPRSGRDRELELSFWHHLWETQGRRSALHPVHYGVERGHRSLETSRKSEQEMRTRPIDRRSAIAPESPAGLREGISLPKAVRSGGGDGNVSGNTAAPGLQGTHQIKETCCRQTIARTFEQSAPEKWRSVTHLKIQNSHFKE